ncbi:hypothetical protein F5884DRAFT_792437 [Xylogone sp. PMI_703]|nr:hypothetical protein F5884DRAFT_792437 [Xylogone sp. PMI_703]
MAPSTIGLATNPVITGALLYGLLYHPEQLLSIIPEKLHPLVSSPKLIAALKAFFALGVLSTASQKFSDLVVNNWKGPAKFNKNEEVVLITGGASGIGAAVTEELAKHQVKVIILDRNPPAGSLPPNVSFYRADVTSRAELAETAAQIRKEHGDPTVLINNAGVGSGGSILDKSENAIRKIFDVNTISHWWTVKEFLPAMIKKNHGHVITMASAAAYISVAQMVDYSCTKASALAFHEGLSSELKYIYKADQVKTTVITPMWIKTPLIADLANNPKFKAPIIDVKPVAEEITEHIFSGKSGHLVMPKNVNQVSGIRGWPSWLQYGLRNKYGATSHTLEFGKGTY